jgi:hypothetical protein
MYEFSHRLGHERPKGDVRIESVRLPTADIGRRPVGRIRAKSSHFVYQKPYPGWLGEVFRKDKSAKIVLAKRAGFAGDKT